MNHDFVRKACFIRKGGWIFRNGTFHYLRYRSYYVEVRSGIEETTHFVRESKKRKILQTHNFFENNKGVTLAFQTISNNIWLATQTDISRYAKKSGGISLASQFQ